jgi:hypothetical protein
MDAGERRRRETCFPIVAAAGLEEPGLDPHPLLARLRERELAADRAKTARRCVTDVTRTPAESVERRGLGDAGVDPADH